ncbi:hypothetical protein HK100_000141 [Physocladia obscura]|uniref:Uncharacterized protein n=1 Tax=Physocladia obscura TaxID=109957 RepID=A0AAD5T1M0_9FUNG|nr:hypothetical protein HK100_000141 [Physocladia obscura]
MECVVTLPPSALTAQGLSTPWTVTGCDQTVNPTFAECVVVNPATGTLGVYSPLLINKGSTNFVTPVVPILPANGVVGCWFGTNGVSTTLAGATAAANCTSPTTALLQFAACNGPNFFAAVKKTNVVIPPLGTGNNGKPCYTIRSFEIVDMDQSDNVVTTFLQDPVTNKLAQKTVANLAALPNATEVNNGSDNILLDAFYRPALGCTAFTAANLADPTGPPVGALALNEIQANALQAPPIALIPPTDPFTLDGNGNPDFAKQTIYRASVNQPPPNNATSAAQSLEYCQNLLNVTAPGYITDLKFLIGQPSPALANGKDLFTFLAQRFAASWAGLTCNTLIPLTDVFGNAVAGPLTANFDGNGVCISATFNTPTLVKLLLGNGGPTTEALALGVTGTTTLSKTTTTTTTSKSTTNALTKSTTTKTTTTTKSTTTTSSTTTTVSLMNCVVTLPKNALTAQGLSTPWTVTGCDQTVNPTFAECAVIDPATGTLGVYSPLLINEGSTNFIEPVVPILPANGSDNVVTTFLQDPVTNKLAQKTVANLAALPNATEVNNGSDNILLDAFYRPALGCTAFTAANLADPTGPPVGALALNEIQANALQAPPIALIPPTDPFTLDGNGNPDFAKQTIYRASVNQPPPNNATSAAQSLEYCQNLLNVTAPGYITDLKFLIGQPSPALANGKDLFTFLAQRFAASWAGLTCNTLIPLTDVFGNAVAGPLTANFDGNGVCISATFNTPTLVKLLLGNGGPTTEALALGVTGTTTLSKTTATTTTSKSTTKVLTKSTTSTTVAVSRTSTTTSSKTTTTATTISTATKITTTFSTKTHHATTLTSIVNQVSVQTTKTTSATTATLSTTTTTAIALTAGTVSTTTTTIFAPTTATTATATTVPTTTTFNSAYVLPTTTTTAIPTKTWTYHTHTHTTRHHHHHHHHHHHQHHDDHKYKSKTW